MSSLSKEFDALRIPGELLQSGKKMAVIIEKMISYETEDELLKLVSIISRFKHNNIATFVGFSYGDGNSYIVTECEVNGNVGQILNIVPVSGSSSINFEEVNKNLTCSQRLKIRLGVARALSHIHGCDVRYSDFSSTRILLDKDLEAKVVAFGIIIEKKCYFTFSCYTDPEFKKTQLVSQKSDVYSFGVVLIDMFCQHFANSLRGVDTEYSGIDYTHFDDDIRQQMHSLRALTILSKTLNKCLNEV
ncbi:probable serine/threonine-protein kinase PBL28 [Rutidosis leptorrhynchoides]|uniref:probable serine/threonine-protein kinase PBL28 n=1 Tax=Rutidosis leptorrhynchoides TaxID=125765 RepID=UPI003A9A41D1